ncbi:Arm DNA-binding domain-containing protein [Neisseria sp. WF04]|uniref:Arm DNA-binding domain-containing protein n=1 Tax=unclassified Neisseria TaxID=2623750 RepID=UPI0034CE57CB
MVCKPNGGKLWRLKYRIDGKEKLLSIGKYPAVSLSEARKAAENARRLLRRASPAAAKQQGPSRNDRPPPETALKKSPASGIKTNCPAGQATMPPACCILWKQTLSRCLESTPLPKSKPRYSWKR